MYKILLSAFGAGYSRFAPGTCGSAVMTAVFLLVAVLTRSPIFTVGVLVIAGIYAFIVTLVFGERAIKELGNDPGLIVTDEVCGQAITYLWLWPMFDLANNKEIVTFAFVGFILFRIFDIIKPWPACYFDRQKSAWGVLMDDVIAGIYANIVLQITWRSGLVDFVWTQFQLAELTYFNAVILGVIQGLTEFLPVSSSGHLVILQHFMEMNPEDQAMILFDLAVHLGTVVAILIYYRNSIRKYVSHLLGSLNELSDPIGAYKKSASIRFTVLAVAAIVTTGVFYVLFKDFVKQGFEKPWVVAVCWIITASVLLLADRKRQCRRSLRNFGLICAVVVGVAQGLALFPGISRSGSTIERVNNLRRCSAGPAPPMGR